jgi:hypothetical protein
LKYLKKFFKNLILIIIALVIAKWIIMFVPSASNNVNNSIVTQKEKIENNRQTEKKEVELNINFDKLRPQIEEEYEKAKQDIYNYIDKKIYERKEISKERLTREDGFLDWIFDYFTKIRRKAPSFSSGDIRR